MSLGRVVIPAAGQGRRLLPVTAELPKCLITVGGMTIIDRLLGQLRQAGVEEAVIVTGYRAELVQNHIEALVNRPRVRFVDNRDYARCNSIVSVLATVPFWDGDVAIIDSDVLVSSRIIDQLLHHPGNALVVDTSRSADQVDMAVEIRSGAVWHLDKAMAPERISGEALPLSRWDVDGGSHLRRIMSGLVKAGAVDVWYQWAIREAAKQIRVTPLQAGPGEWMETDRESDLRAAAAGYAAGAAWAQL